MPLSLQSRAIAKASEVLGGAEELAKRLGVSPAIVHAWIAGKVPIPNEKLFDVVDILLESGDLPRAANGEAPGRVT